MGKRRRTRAEKVRRDQRRAAEAAFDSFARDTLVLPPAARRAPCGCPPDQPRKSRTREFDGRAQVEVFWVERQSVTFGHDHPKLRHAVFGKSGVVRDGPFGSWRAARESIAEGDAPGARIFASWEDADTVTRRKPGAFKNDDGTVTLVKAPAGEVD